MSVTLAMWHDNTHILNTTHPIDSLHCAIIYAPALLV